MRRVTNGALRFVLGAALLSVAAPAQTLNLPPRPANAPTGTQFTNIITSLPAPTSAASEREYWIYAQVVSGNVPDFLRTLLPVSVSYAGHTAIYHVAPDFLAIGSDEDYFLTPMTPLLAQRLADRLGCSLPTRKMSNQIWTNAAFKMNPVFIPPSAEMITVPIFAQHNEIVRTQRVAFTNTHPLGALVAGNKKDLVISTLIYSNLQAQAPKPAVIFGWHYQSGAPIQPLYNGHEESYADYSHGARLVQMSLTVDGAATTVTNVLTSPALAGLLSDETIAPSSTIPRPRYTVPPLAPVVMTHPRSQSVYAGAPVTFSTRVIGDLPLAHRWQFNGAPIAGATNLTFSLTNVSAADAGNYSVVATNNSGASTGRVAVLRVRTNAFPTLFADDFDTDSSASWNLFWGATNGIPDYDVDWAFDHGAIPCTFNGVTALIPPAPNSPDGGTRALRLAVNQNDGNAAIAAANLYPKDQNFTGNFALKFDLWIQYPGNAGGINSTGSTQHAIFGINHLGTNANWAAPSALASDGLWFGVTGEGGDSSDYRSYAGNLAGTQINLTGSSVASGLVATNHTAAVFQNLLPGSRFETIGAPGKNWVEVEVRYMNNFVLWLLDGAVIAQRTNSSAFTNGTIMIGLMDVFNSIANPARDSFALFDNLRVEDLSPAPIQFQSAGRFADGVVSLRLTNAPGDRYWLDASTNLETWQAITFVTATNTMTSLTDSNASAFATRFYRARR